MFGGSGFFDRTKIVDNIADDPSFFPRLALRSFGTALVSFPSAFWEDPTGSPSGLDQKNMCFGCIERHNTCNESFAAFAVA
jgi:hypothetical protein